jgi:hypothetical protein
MNYCCLLGLYEEVFSLTNLLILGSYDRDYVSCELLKNYLMPFSFICCCELMSLR